MTFRFPPDAASINAVEPSLFRIDANSGSEDTFNDVEKSPAARFDHCNFRSLSPREFFDDPPHHKLVVSWHCFVSR